MGCFFWKKKIKKITIENISYVDVYLPQDICIYQYIKSLWKNKLYFDDVIIHIFVYHDYFNQKLHNLLRCYNFCFLDQIKMVVFDLSCILCVVNSYVDNIDGFLSFLWYYIYYMEHPQLFHNHIECTNMWILNISQKLIGLGINVNDDI